jgi:hypothetical protein
MADLKAQQTQHPPSIIAIPDDAYTQPTPEEVDANPTYWEGYSGGMAVRSAIPSPAGSNTYENYRTWVDPLLLPASTEGFPNNTTVGYNNAVIQGANYMWTNDPKSPFKIPPG